MATMLFADLGASIIRLDRLTPSGLGIDKPARFDLIARSRPSVAVDLKHPEGLALAADLIGEALRCWRKLERAKKCLNHRRPLSRQPATLW